MKIEIEQRQAVLLVRLTGELDHHMLKVARKAGPGDCEPPFRCRSFNGRAYFYGQLGVECCWDAIERSMRQADAWLSVKLPPSSPE